MAAGRTLVVGGSGALAPFGTAAEIVEEDPPGGPGMAVLVVFRGGEIETFEDPELCPVEGVWVPERSEQVERYTNPRGK